MLKRKAQITKARTPDEPVAVGGAWSHVARVAHSMVSHDAREQHALTKNSAALDTGTHARRSYVRMRASGGGGVGVVCGVEGWSFMCAMVAFRHEKSVRRRHYSTANHGTCARWVCVRATTKRTGRYDLRHPTQ